MISVEILLIIEGCPDRVRPSITTKPSILPKTLFHRFSPKFIKVKHGLKKIQPPTSKKTNNNVFLKKKKLNWDFHLEISHLRKKVFILTSKM